MFSVTAPPHTRSVSERLCFHNLFLTPVYLCLCPTLKFFIFSTGFSTETPNQPQKFGDKPVVPSGSSPDSFPSLSVSSRIRHPAPLLLFSFSVTSMLHFPSVIKKPRPASLVLEDLILFRLKQVEMNKFSRFTQQGLSRSRKKM